MRKSAEDFVASRDSGISLVCYGQLFRTFDQQRRKVVMSVSLYSSAWLVFSSAKRSKPSNVQETTHTFW
jgi:hypothetical protein